MIEVHPTAVIHPSAELGHGVRVGAYTTIGAGVTVGPRTVVGARVSIFDRAIIGAEVEVWDGAMVGGAPQIRASHQVGRVVIGDRTVLREFVTVHAGSDRGAGETRIGADVWLMVGAHVGHDVIVGDRSTITNGAALAGHVEIGSDVTLGGLVGVHQWRHIGRGAMVAAGSQVSLDVPPYTLVHDGSYLGVNSVGLERLGFAPEEVSALEHCFELYYRTVGGRDVRLGAAAWARVRGGDEVRAFLEAHPRCVARAGAR